MNSFAVSRRHLLPLLVIVLLLAGCGPSGAPSGKAASPARYHCPMHPSFVSDQPIDCAICGMKLVPIDSDSASTATAGEAAALGRVAIHVSPEKQQRIGLRTATAERRSLTRTLRLTGVVQHDETTLVRIAPRFGGWIRKLHVNYTGQEVHAGQPLLSVYSPELLVTERDYLLAYRQTQTADRDAAGTPPLYGLPLLDAARERLRLWEISDEEIRALEDRGCPTDEVLLRAPLSGHVISKAAVEGRSFIAGETLFEIGQWTNLWVSAAVFEQDLPRVRTGQTARVVFPFLDDRTIETAVAFVSPHINPQTRRGEARLNLANANLELRPEMWARVELDLDLGEVLAVPASAVLDTGRRSLAFVQRPEDHLEPRELTLGVRTDDFIAVRAGLEEGEKVVTRALFLIDSESQMKAALAALAAGDNEAP